MQLGKKISELNIGDRIEVPYIITQEQVDLFARATGDHNPLHSDEAYAATTQFKSRIAHGVLLSGIVSGVIGMKLPGLGTIAREMSSKFLQPVYPGDTVTVAAEVTEVNAKLNIAVIDFKVKNQKGQLVGKGQAKVLPRL